MTTAAQGNQFFNFLRSQRRSDERLEMTREAQARSRMNQEYAVIKDGFDRIDGIIKDSFGVNYEHNVALKQGMAKSLSPFWQQRMGKYLSGSVGSETDQKLRAFDKARPKKDPPGTKIEESSSVREDGTKSFESKKVVDDSNVSLFEMADHAFYEKDRVEDRLSITSGVSRRAQNGTMLQIGTTTWASRRSDGTFNYHTEDQMAKKEFDEKYGTGGAAAGGGTGVSTPIGRTQSIDVIGEDGKKYTTTTQTFAPGMVPADAKNVKENSQGDPYIQFTTPHIDDLKATAKDHREMTVAFQNLNANPGYYKKAWKGEKSVNTNEAAVLAMWNTIDAGRSVQQALDGLALSTPGYIPLLLKGGDWEQSMWGKATFAHNAGENLVFRKGRYETFLTSDNKEVRLIVEPDGRVIDPKKMFGSPTGWWAADVDSAREQISSLTAKQLSLSDSTGKPVGWDEDRKSAEGVFLPEFLSSTLDQKQGSERSYMVAGMGPRTVTNIYDADTIFLERDDALAPAEKIRMLAIDAPEIISQYNKGEISKEEAFMGDRSKQWLAKWLGGEEVNLTYSMDETQNYGYYDRTLAYVYRASDGKFLQEEILKAGMAMYNKKFPAADKAMEQILINAQAYAMKHALGVWQPRDDIENLVALQEEVDEYASEAGYQPASAIEDQMKQLFTDLSDMAYPLPGEFLDSFKIAMRDFGRLFVRQQRYDVDKESFNMDVYNKVKKDLGK